MTANTEHADITDELYGFIQHTLTEQFRVTKTIVLKSVLSDDLGLEPEDWYVLAGIIENKYGIEFSTRDLIVFDRDSPLVQDLVRITLTKLEQQLPLDEYVFGKVAELIEEFTGIDASEVYPEMLFVDDLCIDSMARTELVVRSEDALEVKIPDESIREFIEVRHLVDCISKLRQTCIAA